MILIGFCIMKCFELIFGLIGMYKILDLSIFFEIIRVEWYISQNYCIMFENFGFEVVGIFVLELVWS